MELECYPGSDEDISDELPGTLGISGDGSLSSGGVEFQTPRLAGLAGERYLHNVCDILNREGYSVDRSCGMHVHIDAADFVGESLEDGLRTNMIKRLWLLFAQYEEVFMSFVPPSRRTNRYCSSLADEYSVQELRHKYSVTELEKLWYRCRTKASVKINKDQHYNDTRYRGFNFHELLSNANLEVRLHSGTLNASKILHWVALHQACMDAAADLSISTEFGSRVVTLRDKTERLFAILGDKITAQTRDYLLSRQRTFTVSNASDEDEMPCAE